MALSTNDIILQPIAYRRSIIGHIWEDLSHYSVEAIAANRAGVYDFAEQDCMYFAVIKRLIRESVPEEDETDDDVSASEDETEPWEPPAEPSESYIYLTSSALKIRITEETIGVIYLSSAQLPGCVNLGVCILPELRGQGYGTQAVRLVLGWAFEELGCHRIQVRIADGDQRRRNRAIGMLNSLGFCREGVCRRAVFCPPRSMEEHIGGVGGQWRDVLTYGILDTDWVVHRDMPYVPPSVVKTRWEEIFRRHEQEREEMLAFEERQEQRAFKERELSRNGLKRTASMETIKDTAPTSTGVEHEEDLWETYGERALTGNGDSGNVNTHAQGPPQDEIHELQELLDGMLNEDQQHSSGPLSVPSPSLRRSLQGHRDPFTFIPSAARFRSASPSIASVTYTENEYHSSASSPLLPRSPQVHTLESDMDSEWEVGGVPRSPSVLSSSGSTSSWDLFESSETSSEASSAALSEL